MVAGTGELNRARSKSIVNADAGLSPSVPRTSVVDKSHARSRVGSTKTLLPHRCRQAAPSPDRCPPFIPPCSSNRSKRLTGRTTDAAFSFFPLTFADSGG